MEWKTNAVDFLNFHLEVYEMLINLMLSLARAWLDSSRCG